MGDTKQKSQQNEPRLKPIIVGRVDLARLMGVTPNEISKLLDEGLPALSAGRKGIRSQYDAVEVLAWWREKQAADEEDAKQRYFRLQGDKIEQEIAKRAGELVEASEVEDRWAGMVVSMRERLLSIPSTALQRGIVNDAGEEVLIELVDDALSELGKPQEKMELA